MSKIVFLKDLDNQYECIFSQIGNNQVRLVFSSENIVPSKEILLSGFNIVNEHNGYIQTRREDYIYLYRSYEDKKVVELCNDNKQWTKPKATVSFLSSFGGNLEGDLKQTEDNYEDLVIPIPIPNENYEFVGWIPEIPKSGEITKSISFTANFEYIPTLENIKNNKKEEIQNIYNEKSIAGVVYEDFNFPYTESDKEEIKAKLETAIKLNESVIVYTSTMTQKLLTVEQIKELYRNEEKNFNHHKVYFNQMFSYIDSLEDKESIESIEYGKKLEGTYLEEYNNLIAQENKLIEKYIKSLSSSSGNTDISELETKVNELNSKVQEMEISIPNIQNDLYAINEALV